MPTIQSVSAREILDSRGNPTVETTVSLSDGSIGIASCPSGASTGLHEAVELRDNDQNHYMGKGVRKTVQNIETIIAPKLIGKNSNNQKDIDDIILSLDTSANKATLGANATLPVSMAVCRTQAISEKLPLFKYIQKIAPTPFVTRIPTPLFNILNGGKHAGGNIDFQEFIVIPSQLVSFAQALEQGTIVYMGLKKLLEDKHLSTLVGDEGGFGPTLSTNEEALSMVKQAIELAGFAFGKDMFVGLDVASGSFFKDGKYITKEKPEGAIPQELIELYKALQKNYPLFYLEDPLSEDDWDNWTQLVVAFTDQQTIITGDDLLVTNPNRLQMAIDKKAATGIIIKPNQIGTVSETLTVVKLAKQNNIKTIVSHRSGETNDDFIADFAVGVNADFVKFGAPTRGERVAKYNRLLHIEEELNKT